MSQRSYTLPVSTEDLPELIGQLIDTFEDFLDEKGIVLPNKERDGNENLVPEESANIYGKDYDALSTSLEKILRNWSITE